MSPTTRVGALASTKIQGSHHDRLAVVYVRQSRPQQLIRHPESTRLQYGLVDRARALGWAQARVLVIDEDLGKSADSASERSGFQRLVTEVSLAHVGIILGLEMSRTVAHAFERMQQPQGNYLTGPELMPGHIF
jgi:hypothetical protein